MAVNVSMTKSSVVASVVGLGELFEAMLTVPSVGKVVSNETLPEPLVTAVPKLPAVST